VYDSSKVEQAADPPASAAMVEDEDDEAGIRVHVAAQ
jgi:hypothetical protein